MSRQQPKYLRNSIYARADAVRCVQTQRTSGKRMGNGQNERYGVPLFVDIRWNGGIESWTCCRRFE
jgi:hypothetical protein